MNYCPSYYFNFYCYAITTPSIFDRWNSQSINDKR